MIHAENTRIDWHAVKERLHAAQHALEHSSAVDEARMRDVFRRRAEQLAARGRCDSSARGQTPVLAFRLGHERYGIELRHVAQVFPATAITPVPGAPQTLAGVANLHGEVRSILDLRQLLGLPEHDGNTERYILLLRLGDRRAGLRVEQVDGVSPVAMQDLNREQDESTGERAGCIDGVTRDNLIVLRVDVLFDRGKQ
jgi:purine-binding chemotaxis protein CheW